MQVPVLHAALMEAADKRTYVDFAYPSADDAFGKSFQTCPPGKVPQALSPYRWKLARKRQIQIEILGYM